MSAISRKLRLAEGGRLHWFCPGCKEMHGINYGDGHGPRWTWDGNAEAPTFAPSVLVTWAEGEERAPRVCHCFVAGGRIQFLSDCTHALAGQTVDMHDLEVRYL